MRCIAPGCDVVDFSYTTSKGITFIPFPSEQTLCESWLKSLHRRGCQLTEDTAVCSKHFEKKDIYMSRDGQCTVRSGAIPVLYIQNTSKRHSWMKSCEVKVCRVCFATDCNLYTMTKFKKLDEAYGTLTGLVIEDNDSLPPYLCTECSHRLLSCIQFRTKTIEANMLLQDIIQEHDYLTLEAIKSCVKHKQFSSKLGVTHKHVDHFDLEIKHMEIESVTDGQELTHNPCSLVVVKVEKDENDETNCPPRLHEVTVPGIKLEPQDEYDQDNTNDEHKTNELKELPNYHDSMGIRVKVETIEMPEQDGVDDNADGITQSDVPIGEDYPSDKVFLEELQKVKHRTISHIKTYTGKKTHIKKKSGKKSYSCDVCNKEFSKKYNLVIHLRIHSGIKPYSCDFCKQGFSVKCDLVNHMRKHSGEKPYECNICKKTFILKNVLQAHLRTHTGEKPYACKQCDKVFSQRANLSAHIKIHSGEKPYSCEVCNKGFSQRCNLITHARTHSGEKPYSCNICTISFSRNYHLQSHLKVHTGEKPYTCEVCNKAFTSHSNVQKHMTVHSGVKPYTCNVCNRAFNRKGNLNTHIKIHSDEKPFICVVCQKGFRRKDQLKIHFKVHTNEKSLDLNIQD